MGVNSLLKTVIRQRCDCDLNPCPSAPESSMLTTRLLSHAANIKILKCLPWHRNMESQWTLSMRYFTTINHVADNNFVFQQHIALVHYARNTVKLLERELSTSLFTSINYGPPLSISGANSTDIIFRDSLIGISISHRSTRLKKSSSDWLNLVIQVKRCNFVFKVFYQLKNLYEHTPTSAPLGQILCEQWRHGSRAPALLCSAKNYKIRWSTLKLYSTYIHTNYKHFTDDGQ